MTTATVSRPAQATSANGVCDVAPVLERVAATFAGSRHPIHVACDPALRLQADTLAAVEAIAREAVANALQHAFVDGRDGDVWLRLAREDGRLRLTIRDNGVGMPDLPAAPNSGRSRIEAAARRLGGFARMGSMAYRGGEVVVIFPLGAGL